MKILVIAEHDNKNLKSVNFHTINAVKQLSGEMDLFIAGFNCNDVVEQAKKIPNLKHIHIADAKEYEHQLAENISQLIAELAASYQYIITGSTTFGKNVLPRVAALLDVSMISDVIKIVDANTFVRPIYAGNALATVQTQEKKKLFTVRSTAFDALALSENNSVAVEKITKIISNERAKFLDQQLTVSARPELTSARIIVSGGRGLKSAENFKMLEAFADSIRAAIGASRAAVDAGFAPNDYQVGQTGKVVAPDLYIAIGISGAIQHLAGMKDSKVIVAINNDPDAPIFQIADYGLVGDLFTLLPELQAALKQ